MSEPQKKSKKKVTPHSLVKKQVENKDFHVSEEDMANVDTSIETSDNKLGEVSEQMEDDIKGKTETPYDILGG